MKGVRVERLAEQRIAIEKKQLAGFDKPRVAVGVVHELLRGAVQSADKQTTLLGGIAAHGVYEVPPIGKELRPTERGLPMVAVEL